VTKNGTGLLIIRAWIEDGSAKPLRATIRQTTDVSVGIERDLLFADPDAVCAAVQDWLDDMVPS
jgi:hypothetical protein